MPGIGIRSLLAMAAAMAVLPFVPAAARAGTVVLDGNPDLVRQVSFSPDGARVVTASRGGTVMVFEAATGEVVAGLKGHEDTVFHAAFSPDGSRIVTSSRDKTARVFEAATGRPLLVLPASEVFPDEKLIMLGLDVVAAAFSPDGTRIVTLAMTPEDDMSAPLEGSVRVWDAVSGERLYSLALARADQSAAFSPDGARLVTTSKRGVWVWDAASGDVIRMPPEGEGDASLARFSPDGTRIVAGKYRRGAWIFDASGFEVLHKISVGPGDVVVDVGFSADGARALVASQSGSVRIVDTASGAILMTLKGGDNLRSAAFSPDGRMVLTMTGAVLALFDLHDGSTLYSVSRGKDYFQSVAFSPDGSRIAGALQGNRVLVWDTTAPPDMAGGD